MFIHFVWDTIWVRRGFSIHDLLGVCQLLHGKFLSDLLRRPVKCSWKPLFIKSSISRAEFFIALISLEFSPSMSIPPVSSSISLCSMSIWKLFQFALSYRKGAWKDFLSSLKIRVQIQIPPWSEHTPATSSESQIWLTMTLTSRPLVLNLLLKWVVERAQCAYRKSACCKPHSGQFH